MVPPPEESAQNTPHFYRNLSGFNEFTEINNSEHYKKVPEDWFVLISDIVGSTKAIDSGRYKDVNTLGAATVSVLQKCLGTFHFPFVFGGDGATALIHHKDLQVASNALLQLKQLAQQNFAMDLRIGAISIREVHEAGYSVEVAKYFMNPKKSIAMIRGGGLSWADDKIKSDPEKYGLFEGKEAFEDLQGLSCRWQPLHSRRGKVMTFLVKPNEQNSEAILTEIVNGLSEIFKKDFDRPCPVQDENMRYKNLFQCLKDEWKYSSNHVGESFFRRVISVLICVWAFKLKLPVFFDSENYVKSIFSHSDYKKFDDTLRMVADCTMEECIAIEKLFHEYYEQGKIFFGIHYSDYSLMTCLVENTQQGGHIHFIDGGDGGYAMAAKTLKKQLKTAESSQFKQAT